MEILLPFGHQPAVLRLPAQVAERSSLFALPAVPTNQDIASEIEAALDRPIDSLPLEVLASAASKIVIVVADATRTEPRTAMLEAIRKRVPANCEIVVAIATGTHGPSALAQLALPPWISRVINHDGHSVESLVDLGSTSNGTHVRLHRCLLDADLVVCTGVIRPHYFAGFGAGLKAIFPGLGYAPDIRFNHILKQHRSAHAGNIDDNRCRDDMEQAARKLPTPIFLLNGIANPDGMAAAFVAGSPLTAFRAGAAVSYQWHQATIHTHQIVIASDRSPVTNSLYQASKIAAACACLVAPGGHLVIAADCVDGIGPLDVVNHGIFAIGIAPRLAPGVTVHLWSHLSAEVVSQSYAKPVEDLLTFVAAIPGSIAWLPTASNMIIKTHA